MLLIATSCLVLVTGGVEGVATALEPVGDCADGDGCPPGGDHCGDCLRCGHARATTAALVGPARLPIPRAAGAAPAAAPSLCPPAAPVREIFTVPRA